MVRRYLLPIFGRWAFLSVAAAAFVGAEEGPLKPSALWPDLKFDAYQAFQADARGEVFFFRGDELAAYPVGRRQERGQPVVFQVSGTLDGEVAGAVLDPSGEYWLVMTRFPRLFRQGREVFLQSPPFVPFGAWFAGGQPVAGVWPLLIAQDPSEVERFRQGPSPWFVRWNGKEWETWLTVKKAKELGFSSPGSGDMEERAASLVAAKGGTVVASIYDHRMALLDANGKTLAAVAVPLQSSPESPEEAARRLEASMKRQGMDPSAARVVFASRRTPAILGLTTCGTGEVLVAVSSVVVGKGIALERWRVGERRLQRLRLDLDIGGKLSLACGTTGLYLAAYRGSSGRWWISRETWENSRWQEVEGAVFAP